MQAFREIENTQKSIYLFTTITTYYE